MSQDQCSGGLGLPCHCSACDPFGTSERIRRERERDYCFTCGGEHPTETHDHGRVIRVPASQPSKGSE